MHEAVVATTSTRKYFASTSTSTSTSSSRIVVVVVVVASIQYLVLVY